MAKTHTTHPTQHAACGAPSYAHVVNEDVFLTSANQCKRCVKVLAARDAGRPVYSGLEPAALEGLSPGDRLTALTGRKQ